MQDKRQDSPLRRSPDKRRRGQERKTGVKGKRRKEELTTESPDKRHFLAKAQRAQRATEVKGKRQKKKKQETRFTAPRTKDAEDFPRTEGAEDKRKNTENRDKNGGWL